MLRSFPLGLFVCLLLGTSVYLNGQPVKNTLLYRIEGPQLKQPSYLYGVLHLNDKRLFNFPDSVYAAIKQCNGFATEIEPEYVAELMLNNMSNNQESEVLLRDVCSAQSWAKYAPLIQKMYNTDPETLSLKQALAYISTIVSKSRKLENDLPDMDIYLLEYARRKGKNTSGLTELLDQKGQLHVLFDASDLELLVADHQSASIKKAKEKVLQHYLASDLTALSKSMESSLDIIDPIFIKRNRQIVHSIDSLVKIESTFITFAAKYLLGDSGLPGMMKELGYQVTPVYPTAGIAMKDYPLPPSNNEWVTFEDPANNLYTASFPVKPIIKNTMNLVLLHFAFEPFEKNGYFMTAFTEMGQSPGKSDILDHIAQKMLDTDKTPRGTALVRNGIKGKNYVHASANEYKRLQLYKHEGSIYAALYMNENAKPNTEKEARFFASITLHEAKANNEWTWNRNKISGFEIQTPGPLIPNKEIFANANIEAGWNVNGYTYVDPKTGFLYMLSVTNAINDLFIPNDSLYLQNIRANQITAGKAFKQDTIVRRQGYLTYQLQCEIDADGYEAKSMFTIRNNRIITPLVIYPANQENHPDIIRYTQSFSLLEFHPSDFTPQPIGAGLATTVAPAPFAMHIDSSGARPLVSLNSRDTMTSEIYAAILSHASTKQWYRNAGEYWEEKLANYSGEEDSIIQQYPVVNEKANGYHAIVQGKGNTVWKHLRFLPFADSLVTLFAISKAGEPLSAKQTEFFEAFWFNEPYREPVLFENRAAILLTDLLSTDTATTHKAYLQLDEAPFSIADIPLLRKALMQHYPWDTIGAGYSTTVNEKVGVHLLELADPSLHSFVKREYNTKSDRDWHEQTVLLNLLAQQADEEAYSFIAKALNTIPGDAAIADDVLYSLTDSNELLAEIYPEIRPLLAKENMKTGMLAVLHSLLREDKINAGDFSAFHPWILNLLQRGILETTADTATIDYYSQFRAISIAAKIKTAESITLLQQATGHAFKSLSQHAGIELLKLNEPVNAGLWNNLAAEKGFRYGLYEALSSIDKTALFPAKWASQSALAEGLLWNYASEDANPLSIVEIATRKDKIGDVQANLYLFELTFNTVDGSQSSRLGIAAFPANKKELKLIDNNYEIDWETVYLPKEKNKQIQTIIQWFKEL